MQPKRQFTKQSRSLLHYPASSECTVGDQNKIGQGVTLDSFTIQRFTQSKFTLPHLILVNDST
jgi:hypothetical protein